MISHYNGILTPSDLAARSYKGTEYGQPPKGCVEQMRSVKSTAHLILADVIFN
jgi:hypothetical protein